MAIDTVAGLLDALRGSPLLKPDQFAELAARHAVDIRDPQDLTRHLIKLKWLTLYQAKKILAGKAGELVIGHYTVLDKLGEGGMGRVYKAVQQNLGRIVALKVVRSSLLKNETALKRFRREVKAAASLSHPNIVRVFDADQDGDRHFLAMENIEGADLGRLVKDHGPLPVPVACSYIRQAALGLQHAHDMSIVHRDIKPSNLLVAVSDKSQYGPRNVVKILDMGLARSLGDDQTGEGISTELTRTGTVVGTPDYMSPEQAKNSSTVDSRSDLYALGCTFFFLLTGEVVFPKGNPLEKLLQHQLDAPRPIQLLRLDLPPEVASIIQCLLAKKPEQRFQSGAALANALEPWCSGKGQTAFTPAAVVAEAADPTTTTETPKAESPFNFDDGDTELTPTAPRETARPARPAELAKAGPKPRSKFLPYAVAVIVGSILLAVAAFFVLRAMFAKTRPTEPTTSATTEARPKEAPKPKDDPKPNEEPKGAGYIDVLEKYIPDDAAVVLVIQVKHLAETAAARQHLLAPLQARLAPLKFLAGIDLFQFVERGVVVLPAADGQPPTIILQGKTISPERFAEWVKKFPAATAEDVPDTGLQIVRLPAGKGDEGDAYAAAVGTSIIVSPSRDRVVDALNKRDGAVKTKFADPTVEAGLKHIYLKPSAAVAVFGLRGPLAELSEAAKALKFFVAGVGFEERAMMFHTLADEAEAGKALEFQRALGGHFKTMGKKPGTEDARLDRLGEAFTDAKPGLFGPGKGRFFSTVLPVRPGQIEEWLKPFFEARPEK